MERWGKGERLKAKGKRGDYEKRKRLNTKDS